MLAKDLVRSNEATEYAVFGNVMISIAQDKITLLAYPPGAKVYRGTDYMGDYEKVYSPEPARSWTLYERPAATGQSGVP